MDGEGKVIYLVPVVDDSGELYDDTAAFVSKDDAITYAKAIGASSSSIMKIMLFDHIEVYS